MSDEQVPVWCNDDYNYTITGETHFNPATDRIIRITLCNFCKKKIILQGIRTHQAYKHYTELTLLHNKHTKKKNNGNSKVI